MALTIQGASLGARQFLVGYPASDDLRNNQREPIRVVQRIVSGRPVVVTKHLFLDKYDWAEKHIQNLHAVFRKMREEKPVTTLREADPKTGDVTCYVERVPTIPSTIPLITGDALYSLRGALDYLACGLAEVVDKNTKFPTAVRLMTSLLSGTDCSA